MELQNYERELKYLTCKDISFQTIMEFLQEEGYSLVEMRNKKKDEIYYDDNTFSCIKSGDVIRSTTHYNSDGTYSHYMYKKNVSDPQKPYLSKYEYGSGQYSSISEFMNECGIDSPESFSDVLHATIERETCVVQKDMYRLLISYDLTKYIKEGFPVITERMLEIEDWTTPYTLKAENSLFDDHLLDIHKKVMETPNLPLQLTKESKPFRGLKLLSIL